MSAIRLAMILGLWGGAVHADPLADVIAAAGQTFDNLPSVSIVPEIAGRCGADHSVNADVAYCTSENTVFLTNVAAAKPEAAYLVAHVFGHAAQVQHGIADVALATIRANRDQEAALRAEVSRQVDCIAGLFFHRANQPRASLNDWFDTEPFTGAHWGRDPLSSGPHASIGLAERDRWFQVGQNGDIAACAQPTFGADLLIRAIKD